MSRFSRGPLFGQVLGLVVAAAVLAQVAGALVLYFLPGGHEPFTLADAAKVVRTQRSIERNGFALRAETRGTAPERWDEDDSRERRFRTALAAMLDVSPADVLVEDRIPIPGGAWLIRAARRPLTTPPEPVAPSPDHARLAVGDLAAAVRMADGRWIVITPDDGWPGPGSILLLWLAFNGLFIVPLAWLFTRRLVRPIREFAATADRAGRGDAAAAFTGSGPREVRAAAEALSEMQRKIRDALDERTKLLGAIAHDLRTPLARIRFRAEHAPAEHRDKITADIERMDAMIEGVLAFVRGEAVADRHRLDFTALVRSVVDDWTDAGADAAVLEAPSLLVEGDAVALRRMVSNLVDNAAKYAGNVCCHLERDGADILLSVEDAGPGIDPSAFRKALTPFERGDATRDPATGGVGLGLPIARGIARSHGGELTLGRSDAGGLRVLVRLPGAADRPV